MGEDVDNLAEDILFEELVILNRPCLLYFTLYMKSEKHIVFFKSLMS